MTVTPHDRDAVTFSPPAGVARCAVLGTGLIGGSVAASLGALGIEVVGWDRDERCVARALELGVVGSVAASLGEAVAGADVVFVAVPVGATAEVAIAALDAEPGSVVTDVGSVKGAVVDAVEAARPGAAGRFVGGHPMAGSEQDGVDGSRADLFAGATWVLTPTEGTDATAFATLRSLVAAFGAEAIALSPHDHDVFVATMSHVPQLASSVLMDTALGVSARHGTLLRLAAGGFRDMTRIAAGNASIWPDILTANRDAVLASFDRYLAELAEVRAMVAAGDRVGLLAMLQRARQGRRSLPIGAASAGPLVELRVLVPDRPGVLSEITTLAGRLSVNVFDLEFAHSLEGDRGVMVLVVSDTEASVEYEVGLRDLGYPVTRGKLE